MSVTGHDRLLGSMHGKYHDRMQPQSKCVQPLSMHICNKLEACKERKPKLEGRYDTGG